MTDPQPYPPRRYAWFVVFVLILASLIAFIDRQVVAIVVGPMQQDLGVGDTEIGWLYGVFALFYAAAALPTAPGNAGAVDIGDTPASWGRPVDRDGQGRSKPPGSPPGFRPGAAAPVAEPP